MLLARLSALLILAIALPACAEQTGASLQISPELTFSGAAASPDLGIKLAPRATPSLEIRDDPPPLPTIDLTTRPDDLWQRMRNGFGMPDLESPLVADRQAWYLNRPEMLRRIFERSRKYLYHIVDELEKRGMPTELALLPIIESSFNPLAQSPARALGMWQFIPSTGKTYNLKQNWWVDERRDIIASTTAALDYLQFIYEMHGDWHLALASYNWGENAVARAIAKNQARGLPTDYPHLTMPGETRYYVPKLQAIKNIIAQPELFGLKLDTIPNEPYFATVDVTEPVDILTAAKLADTSVEEFIALNPAYHRPVILGENRSPLVIPAEKMPVFLANLARYEAEDKPLSSWRTYPLKHGEKLEAVAARLNIPLARLKQLNGITRNTKILPGQNLLIPAPGSAVNPDRLTSALPKAPGELLATPTASRSRGARASKPKPGGKPKIVGKPRHPHKKATTHPARAPRPAKKRR